MAGTANLKPWHPGQSGNPCGRPKRDGLTTALYKQLATQIEGGRGAVQTVAEAIAAALIKRALGGDLRAIHEIADRTEGRPRQQLQIESADASSEDAKYDWSRLNGEQLCQLMELLQIARGNDTPHDAETSQQ